ncbi:ABC transporter permease [Paenibacillus alkalitolerans]|uniref:ABC transporter permease n=1 Tax=Paenibacillus alkalitolerans TaxID=2799335 RepID=UPI0018F57CD2|nr:ABC transporter permease [Paenibacillus alkalitolerans]
MKKRNAGTICVYVFASMVLLFLMLPTFIVIPISFSSSRYMEFPPPGFSLQWYRSFLLDSQWMDAFYFSIKVGVSTMIISVILGTMAALSLARGKSKLNTLFYYLLLTPMIVPLIIIAVAVYNLFIRVNLQGSFAGIVIAHSIVATPYVITTVLGALRSFDIRIEQAAISLGAHPMKAFMMTTVPIIAPSLISGGLFAFVASFDELIISIFVSDTFSKTLPVKMWEGIRLEIDPTLAAIASILIVISVFLLLSVEFTKMISKKRGLSN